MLMVYRQLNISERLSVTKDVFARTDKHIEQGDALGPIRPADFERRSYQISAQRRRLDLVPCHTIRCREW